MTGDNQDGFIFLPEEEVSQSKLEALNTVRFGNNSLDKQFYRDIELMSLAIVQCGPSEQDKIKADILLKSMLLLFFGQIYYRHISDQRFYPFDTLNSYFKYFLLTHFPIAALLLHGSRVLIEFPIEITRELVDWFIIDKSSWRYLATHSISALTEAEVIPRNLKNKTSEYPVNKCLKEEKVSGAHAAINLLSNSISGLMANAYFSFSGQTSHKINIAEHYGIDLALGGVGNQHFASKKVIQNDGQHGHLYINFYQGLAQKNQSGLLLGIEQSAPGKPDQYGGEHDISASNKDYSASGGDFFCKKPSLLEVYQKDYQGLTVLPFANYYDSLWNFITPETFVLIRKNFEKCKCLLSLLTKEKSLAFIKHILAAPGGANQEDFDALFDRYFQVSANDKLKTLQQHIQSLKSKNQRFEAIVKADFYDLKTEMQLGKNSISEQLQNLAIEKNNSEKNYQELSIELIHLREQQAKLQNGNKILLINLAQSFMQCVINQMGWFANKSQKKKIMLSFQQFDGNKLQIKITSEQIRNLLKNFITVSLMNRYGLNNCETHSGRACLDCLNLSQYSSLSNLLFPKTNRIDYNDLVTLIAGDELEKKKRVISAKYQTNLYTFYQEEDSRKNQFLDDKSNSVIQMLIS